MNARETQGRARSYGTPRSEAQSNAFTTSLSPVRPVNLEAFKARAARDLPAGHPLLRVLRNVPDLIEPSELRSRLPDWMTLISE